MSNIVLLFHHNNSETIILLVTKYGFSILYTKILNSNVSVFIEDSILTYKLVRNILLMEALRTSKYQEVIWRLNRSCALILLLDIKFKNKIIGTICVLSRNE